MAIGIQQHSDWLVRYTNVTRQVDTTAMDLDALTDIVFMVSKNSPDGSTVKQLKQSTDPARFNVDNSAKTIEVEVLEADCQFTSGTRYYSQLWVVDGSRTYGTKAEKIEWDFSINPS